MTLVDDDAGQFNVNPDTIMTEIRKPVFVDNAVHHALVTSQASNKQKVTIENRNNASYLVTSSNTYSLTEGNSNVQMTHTARPGHDYTGAPFFNNEKISTNTDPSMLLFNSNDPKNQRLKGSSFSSSNQGITLNLNNMQSRTLLDIGYTGGDVHLGQTVDIGLRTTDLAMQLGSDLTETLTSVNIALPRAVTSTNSKRRKHSIRFLAQDFNKVPILQAMKLVSRQDQRVTYFDRFGSLLYIPFNVSEPSRTLVSDLRLGGQMTNPIDNTTNRVTVTGVPIALNINAEATVDDAVRQQTKFSADVQEPSEVVFDPSIKTEAAARRLARNILRASNVSKGSISSDGHPGAWDLRPGNIVTFRGSKHVIMEARHKFSEGTSDFVFLSIDIGVEGVLQDLSDSAVTAGINASVDTSTQIKKEDLSLFDGLEVVIMPITHNRMVGPSGFLIGRNTARSLLGIGKEKIGTSKGFMISRREDI